MKYCHVCSVVSVLSVFISAAALADEGEITREFNPKLEFAFFQPTSDQQTGSLGITYDVSYDLKLNDPLAKETAVPTVIPQRLHFYRAHVYSKGNIPFKSHFGIADFMETGFDAGWQSSKLNMMSRCADDFCSDAVGKESFLLKAAASYQFETDSDFIQKQHAYGVKFRGVYKVGDNSKLQYFNPLEWLPSLIKWSIGDGIKLPGGKVIKAPKAFDTPYLPAINLAVEQVNPEKDLKRSQIDPDLKNYERARVEISYSSTLFKFDEKLYRISFTWRYFQELSPNQAIKDAGLDNSTYRTIALHTPQNLVISYSNGELPFDLASEAVFKLGWGYSF